VAPGTHALAFAGAVTAEAARSGLSRIHRIEMANDGLHAQAVEFRQGIDDWATSRTSAPIDVSRAIVQPIEVSSRQAADAMSARHANAGPSQRERAPMRAPVL
jgi:hypothetical protein